MVEFTVGYAAGVIALGTFIVQLLCPTLLAFIAGGILQDDESAATWNIVTPLLQSSLWTQILQTDTARNKGTGQKLVVAVWLATTAAGLVAVTGVVTPLGLFDEIIPSSQIEPVFQYVADPSSFGVSTPPRSKYSWSRVCTEHHGDVSKENPHPCPYSDSVFTWHDNSTDIEIEALYGYNTSVPQVILDIYSSGTGRSATVSNYFDIQWRLNNLGMHNALNNGTPYLVDEFRQVQVTALDDSLRVVEGLIIDTKSGGVGFRNHTIPIIPDSYHGATWAEDLLFIEPDSVCVDTNVTIDFTVAAFRNRSTDLVEEIAFVDHGGFIDLNRDPPELNISNSQDDPGLYARAYTAAWVNNLYTMAFMNVTNNEDDGNGGILRFSYINSERGKRFELPTDIGVQGLGYFAMNKTFGSSLPRTGIYDADNGRARNTTGFLNPFGIGTEDFADASLLCSGAGYQDIVSITNIFVACGLMYGAPIRTDGGSLYRPTETGSKWSTPIYACSSALKATVRTITFQLNGTNLSDLKVINSQPKNYTSGTMPLWGVEDSGLAVSEISPIWGIVDSAFQDFPNISTVRQPHLYLPGYFDPRRNGFITRYGVQNLPGTDFGVKAMTSVYSASTNPEGHGNAINDYSGAKNMPMYLRWQQLSRTAEDAGKIIDLIWTDLAASAVVGTKGVLGAYNNGRPIRVRPMVRRIRYHMPYAIPAFLTCALLVLLLLAAIVFAILGKASLAALRKRLHQTSPGRIFTSVLYPERSNLAMDSKAWSKSNAKSRVNLSGGEMRRAGRVSDDLYTRISESPRTPKFVQAREYVLEDGNLPQRRQNTVATV